jgi:hypothetical protein
MVIHHVENFKKQQQKKAQVASTPQDMFAPHLASSSVSNRDRSNSRGKQTPHQLPAHLHKQMQ